MTEDTRATETLQAGAVVRVSRANFDVNRLTDVDAMNKKTSEYLIPAIKELPGLIHFYAGMTSDGSIVNVSVWDTEEHAKQLDQLQEMAVKARGEMEAVGSTFMPPIINYPIVWSI